MYRYDSMSTHMFGCPGLLLKLRSDEFYQCDCSHVPVQQDRMTDLQKRTEKAGK
jgi:transcription initiation factor IIE alpha subunit